jgi:hypothetical protein
MDTVSFPIYEPDGKKFHWSPDTIVFPLWIMPMLIAYIFEDYFKRNNTFHSFITTYIIIISIVFLYFLIISFFKHEPLNGTLNKKISFRMEGILVDDRLFKLEDLTDVDFRFYDYYGDRSHSTGRSLNPKMSQGVSNYVAFTNNGVDQKIFFQLKEKDDYKLLVPFINEAIKARKMEFKQGIDLVGIENVYI